MTTQQHARVTRAAERPLPVDTHTVPCHPPPRATRNPVLASTQQPRRAGLAFLVLEFLMQRGPLLAGIQRFLSSNPRLTATEVAHSVPAVTVRVMGLVHLLIQVGGSCE